MRFGDGIDAGARGHTGRGADITRCPLMAQSRPDATSVIGPL
jgi:hypothetical protein